MSVWTDEPVNVQVSFSYRNAIGSTSLNVTVDGGGGITEIDGGAPGAAVEQRVQLLGNVGEGGAVGHVGVGDPVDGGGLRRDRYSRVDTVDVRGARPIGKQPYEGQLHDAVRPGAGARRLEVKHRQRLVEMWPIHAYGKGRALLWDVPSELNPLEAG